MPCSRRGTDLLLLIANLDFEASLAAGKARGSLNRQTLLAATRAGMLLGALGSRGDTVWLPGPAGYFKPLPVPGLEPVEFIHGTPLKSMTTFFLSCSINWVILCRKTSESGPP